MGMLHDAYHLSEIQIVVCALCFALVQSFDQVLLFISLMNDDEACATPAPCFYNMESKAVSLLPWSIYLACPLCACVCAHCLLEVVINCRLLHLTTLI